ncbi:MAG: glutamate racemase [Bacteroidia bacterium]
MAIKSADNRPVGIFDSGIGGLTIVDSVVRLLPSERVVFYGDTAHLPYGDKSSHAIRTYSRNIVEYLIRQDCKAIIIACNTASAVAFRELERSFGGEMAIINVIDPVVKFTLQQVTNGSIGVIGTRRTIRTGIYPRRLRTLRKNVQVTAHATPLLAPMIEEGFFNNKISQTIINNYLSRPGLNEIEALILACTHYPLIRPEIERYYGGKVNVIDSTDAVAQELKSELEKRRQLADHSFPDHDFLVSDFTASFQETTKIFFREKVKLQERRISE